MIRFIALFATSLITYTWTDLKSLNIARANDRTNASISVIDGRAEENRHTFKKRSCYTFFDTSFRITYLKYFCFVWQPTGFIRQQHRSESTYSHLISFREFEFTDGDNTASKDRSIISLRIFYCCLVEQHNTGLHLSLFCEFFAIGNLTISLITDS